jgi:hypothetical protein
VAPDPPREADGPAGHQWAESGGRRHRRRGAWPTPWSIGDFAKSVGSPIVLTQCAVEQLGAAGSRSSVTPDLHPTRRYGPSSSNIEWTVQHADLGK